MAKKKTKKKISKSIAVKDHIELDGVKVKGFLGQGQTWQDVTNQRVKDIQYTNNTGKPIGVSIEAERSSSTTNMIFSVDGTEISNVQNGTAENTVLYGIVPSGSTYKFTGAITTLTKWFELR